MPLPSFVVGRSESGRTLADGLRGKLSFDRDGALHALRQRQVRVNGVIVTDPSRRLRHGQRVEVYPSAQPAKKQKQPTQAKKEKQSPRLPKSVIRHVDDEVVVVEKPSGLTTMRHAEDIAEFGGRAKRFLPDTLADLLPGLLPPDHKGRPSRVRAVHRLDKETSGLVVFARTVAAEGDLGRQFRAHSAERLYLALVRGRAKSGRIESWLIRDRGDGRRGSSVAQVEPGEGQRAVTHVRVIEEFDEFTLVECRLETGRTHQVRIHLGEAGTPLCGERVYDRPLNGRPLPDGSGAKRIMLHAATLGFDHPGTGKRVRWESPLPADMAGLIERLRG
jgi:23S rRNA pseudouridine1911/1915/1917 synthase